jgi:hypothetical protein
VCQYASDILFALQTFKNEVIRRADGSPINIVVSWYDITGRDRVHRQCAKELSQ